MKVNNFEWRGKKVLVTGASGFKGSWLCAALHELGARVYGTVRDQIHPDSAYNTIDLDSRITKVTGDITNSQKVSDMINSIEPDVIFHLAAKALVPVALRDPRRAFDVNIMGTLNIVEACRRTSVASRILITSTDHVFGSVKPNRLPKRGFPENSRVSYSGPYDTSKSAMELLVRSYHSTYWSELPAIGITRCANVFGFGDVNQRRVIPLFLSSSVTSGHIPLKYRNNGRQFIHITDAIAGYIRAASILNEGSSKEKLGSSSPNEIPNDISGRSPFTPTFHFAIESYENTSEPYIRMNALADIVARLFNAEVRETSDAIDFAPKENPIQAINCKETRSSINWEIRKPLQDALTEAGAWYLPTATIDDHKQAIQRDIEFILNGLN